MLHLHYNYTLISSLYLYIIQLYFRISQNILKYPLIFCTFYCHPSSTVTGWTSYRHESTSCRQGVTASKTEILNGSGRQYLATLRLDPAYNLLNILSHHMSPFGIGFVDNNSLIVGLKFNSKP